REAQEAIVERLQPLDGTRTRAWETPDPWDGGRVCRKKADQERLEALAAYGSPASMEQSEARNRLRWARRRQEERRALSAARRRARELATASTPRLAGVPAR